MCVCVIQAYVCVLYWPVYDVMQAYVCVLY